MGSEPGAGRESPDALAALLRWEAAGGTWVAHAHGGSTIVDLATCDGGEVVGHLSSTLPEFVAYVGRGVKEAPRS
jgi:hypothetical protein